MTSSRAAKCCAVISVLILLAASASVNDTTAHGSKGTKRFDDVNFVSLLTVVEQQSSAIQVLLTMVTSEERSLRAEVKALKTNLKALQTKADVAPSSTAVAFSARLSSDQDSENYGVALKPHQTVVFNEAITNVGNAYNTSTGVFTAPLAGTYAFYLHAMSPNKRPYIHLAISKNGATLDSMFAKGNLDTYDQGSTLVSAHLVKGDQVYVKQEFGNAVRAGRASIFTGFLLQAD